MGESAHGWAQLGRGHREADPSAGPGSQELSVLGRRRKEAGTSKQISAPGTLTGDEAGLGWVCPSVLLRSPQGAGPFPPLPSVLPRPSKTATRTPGSE